MYKAHTTRHRVHMEVTHTWLHLAPLQVIVQVCWLSEQAEAFLKHDPSASFSRESVHSGHPIKVLGTHMRSDLV